MAIIKIEPYIIDTTGDFTFNNVTATGNLSSLNANLGNIATANFFSGSGNNLSNISGSNVSGQVGNALVSGTVYTNAQPNITSVGTLTGLTSTGTVNLTGASNVALGPVANVQITGGSNGQYLQTDGSGILTWSTVASGSSSNISNGNSNVNIPSSNGNINFTAVGNTVMVITGTGVNAAGTLNVSGNATLGNIITSGSGGNISNANVISANTITALGNINGVELNLSGNGVFGGNLTVNGTLKYINSTTLSISDPIINLQTGPNGAAPVANTGKDVGTALNYYDTSAKIAWMGWDVSNAEIAFGSNVGISSEVVTFTALANIRSGNASLGNSAVANYFTGNFYGTANSATTAGTVTTNAQPNITSTGSLTGLTVSNASGVVDFTTTANVTLGAVGNLHISGGTNAYVLSTDGAGNLNWVAQSGAGGIANISNGNSNVNIPTSNGNINFSATGNANVVVITGTGANISGTANITGNLSAGNIIAGNFTAGAGSGGSITGGNLVSANYITGTLTTAAQPNITSVGSLTSLTVTGNITSGNANLGNAATANYFIGNFYGTANSATTAGTVTTNAQPNITSIGSLTGLTVSNASGVVNFTTTANVTLGSVANLHIAGGSNGQYLQTDGSGTLTWSTVVSGSTSNISNGNSNVSIPVANGNINFSAVGNANVVVITGTGANISGTANVTGNLVAGNITAGAGTGGSITGGNLVSANYFTGTLTTAAQPNITSVGTLTSLTATGNITGGNLVTSGTLSVTGDATLGNAATANFFIGSGNNLSNISGANVTGQVGNALIAGTVYTNAQPNITSIGSLTGLTVSNATGVVNFTTTANVTLGAVANLHIAGGTNAYVLSTDGTGNLSWVAQSSGGSSNISNGNSNVNIPTSNGNINFSAVGNANVVVVTGTGANINGTLNVTGQSNLGAVGNVVITGGTANYMLNTDGAGNLSWVAPPASANVTVDNFTGNGVQTVFTLSTTPIGINQTSVNYNGATVLRTDYTLANANITFSSAPANGSYIEVTTINLTAGGGGGASSAAAVGYSLIFGG